MCLMKPNYDIIKHISYLMTVMSKWMEQLTEFIDVNKDKMSDDAYLKSMNHMKDCYETWTIEGAKITNPNIPFNTKKDILDHLRYDFYSGDRERTELVFKQVNGLMHDLEFLELMNELFKESFSIEGRKITVEYHENGEWDLYYEDDR